jgi:hypothetical protein
MKLALLLQFFKAFQKYLTNAILATSISFAGYFGSKNCSNTYTKKCISQIAAMK